MTQQTPIRGLPYPELTGPPNGPAQMQALALALDSTGVPRYATAAARDVAIPLAQRVKGMIVFRDELGGVYEWWTGTGWEIFAMLAPPRISGTLRRSDGLDLINGPNNFTGLETVVPAGVTQGTWTTYTDPNGIGRACSVPGIYAVSALLQTDGSSARGEEMLLLGTLPVALGAGGATGVAGYTFGGAGGALNVPAPAGLQVAFRYANYSTTAGLTIRKSRWSAQWIGPA